MRRPILLRNLAIGIAGISCTVGCTGGEPASSGASAAASSGEAAQTPRGGPSVPLNTSRGSVSFSRLLSEAEARRVLEAAGARPYAVFMSIDSNQGQHIVRDDQASLESLGGARRQAASELGGTAASGARVSGARGLIGRLSPQELAANPRELSLARALIASADKERKAAALAQEDGPFIYGVEFLGGPDVQRRLKAAPEVRRVQPGFVVRGRAAAPDPENVSYSPPGSPTAPEAQLSPAEIYERLRTLAEP